MIRLKVYSNIAGVTAEIGKLPVYMDDAAHELCLEVAKYAKKSAKLRAPRATGLLKSLILIEQGQIHRGFYSNKVSVLGGASQYADAVESGFTPHVIPVEYFTMRPKGQWVNNPAGFRWVSKSPSSEGYFMGPALRSAAANVDRIAEKVLGKALNKLRR